METRILRKTALLGGILLIGILIMGQSAMAAKWADTPSGQDCVITEAFVDFETDPKTVTIHGLNFECENLIITLGDYGSLNVISCSPDPDNEIIIKLPSEIQDGDYLLNIQTGSSVHQYDTYNLTIGAVGPEGPQGPEGLPGECDCPVTQEQLEEIYARVEYLESGLLPRFTDMGDGTIRDNNTGLLWLKNANAFGTMNWDSAMYEASELSSGEHGLSDGSADGDWRLPTNEEWKAFYSTVYNNPALVNTKGDAQWTEGDAFTEVQFDGYWYGNYWSSTEYDWYHARFANMWDGHTDIEAKDYHYYVWPVRSDN